MLTNLMIKNFKSWQNTGDIRLAPLTVFFGTNSSGKSSINQLLLMLKQTAQSPDRKRVFYLGDTKTVINLGTYKNIVYDNSLYRKIHFMLEWDLMEKIQVSDVKSRKEFTGNAIRFNCTAGPVHKKNHDMPVNSIYYQLRNKRNNEFKIGMSKDKKGYELVAEKYEPLINPGRKLFSPEPNRFYGFPAEMIANYQNISFVQDLAFELEKQLQRIYYVGPLRDYPQRSYTWSGEVPEDVGWRGNFTVNAILAARHRQIRGESSEKSIPFEEMIARWLKRMELIESFQVRAIGQHRSDYEVMVKLIGMKNMINLTDVGFGVSQVLPILVECFYAPASSTVIIEQPEIHLHPSVQAYLADLFIDAIHAGEGKKDRNIQLIIESHSEHFLRRLQRRIAEEKLSPKDAAIYFCYFSDSGSKIKPLEVDEYGNICNYPDKFFGDEIGDLTAMTEAAIKRQMDGSGSKLFM